MYSETIPILLNFRLSGLLFELICMKNDVKLRLEFEKIGGVIFLQIQQVLTCLKWF